MSDGTAQEATDAIRKAWCIQAGDIYHEMLAAQAVRITLEIVRNRTPLPFTTEDS